MSPEDFYESQGRFAGVSVTDQLSRITWYFHKFQNRDRVDSQLINGYYRQLHLSPPQSSVYLPRMAERKPAILLKDRRGYYLEGKARRQIDDLLGSSPATVMVTKLLSDIVAKVGNEDERVFLDETIRCYKASAFRAVIVMAWNLAFDHLRSWAFSDTDRIDAMNIALQKRYPKLNVILKGVDDFDEIKESQVIDVLYTAKLITKNTDGMLREKLRKRNMAAHPSSIKITQAQADDVVIDLINNIVLKF